MTLKRQMAAWEAATHTYTKGCRSLYWRVDTGGLDWDRDSFSCDLSIFKATICEVFANKTAAVAD
jgi:hypothetical protein